MQDKYLYMYCITGYKIMPHFPITLKSPSGKSLKRTLGKEVLYEPWVSRTPLDFHGNPWPPESSARSLASSTVQLHSTHHRRFILSWSSEQQTTNSTHEECGESRSSECEKALANPTLEALMLSLDSFTLSAKRSGVLFGWFSSKWKIVDVLFFSQPNAWFDYGAWRMQELKI